jgi:hypothetical protein
MTTDIDPKSATAAEIANMIGITVRRVRQMHEDGLLVRQGRGRYDASYAIHIYIGSRMLRKRGMYGVSPNVRVAYSWLSGQIGAPVAEGELQRLFGLFKRWGVSEAQANMAIASAVKLLGEAAPEFAA